MGLVLVNAVYAPTCMDLFANMAWISADNVSESMHLTSASKSSSNYICYMWPTDQAASDMYLKKWRVISYTDILFIKDKIVTTYAY